MRKLLFLASLFALVAGLALSQQDFSKVEVETIEVASSVHMLVGAGGNIGVSTGSDGILVIDDQYAPLTEKILAAIKAISDRPVDFVVNTHWHGDHTGGNENMGKAGAVIVAHRNVRARMSTEQFPSFFDPTPPSPPGALPVVTFTEDVSFHFNGDELHVFHVEPAHTDGDSVVHWRSTNVFHMGDLFFNGGYPYIDLGSGGSADGIIAAANRVLELANDESKIIPGHGELSNKKELTAYRDMMVEVRSRISEHVTAGKSLEQVLAAKPIQDLDAQWGTGFIKGNQITEFVYRSLSN